MKRWGSRGYFFVADAIIGSAIIFFALYVVLTGNVRQENLQIDYDVSEDYASFLIGTKIQDLHNDYVNNLTEKGIILNPRNSVMEQIALFYYLAHYECQNAQCKNNNMSYAQNMLSNITDVLVSQKYGFEYTIIDNVKALNTSIYSRGKDRLEKSNLVISSRKIIFLEINSTAMFGPQIAEIKLWL